MYAKKIVLKFEFFKLKFEPSLFAIPINELLTSNFSNSKFEFSPTLITLSLTLFAIIFLTTTLEPEKSNASFKIF